MLTVYVSLNQYLDRKRNYLDELFSPPFVSKENKDGDTFSLNTEDELLTILNCYAVRLKAVVPDKRHQYSNYLTIDVRGKLDGREMRIYKIIHSQQEYGEFIGKLFSPSAERQEVRRLV